MDGKRLIWALIILAFAVMAVAGPLTMVRQSSAGERSTAPSPGDLVKMAGLTFTPAKLIVPKGSEVVFDNDDAAPHTVTATDNSIDSGVLNPGKAFKLTINKPFDYYCIIHPDMKARVVLSG